MLGRTGFYPNDPGAPRFSGPVTQTESPPALGQAVAGDALFEMLLSDVAEEASDAPRGDMGLDLDDAQPLRREAPPDAVARRRVSAARKAREVLPPPPQSAEAAVDKRDASAERWLMTAKRSRSMAAR